MHESPHDINNLQSLLDKSIERAGDFLRSSFEMPEHSLSAAQLVRCLDGSRTVSLATVTAKGEPRVAPTGSVFWRSHFYIPTVATAARARHALARPSVSLTYYEGNDLAVIVHGHAHVISPEHADFETLESLHRELNGTSILNWGDAVFLKIEPDVIYTYARYPSSLPM